MPNSEIILAHQGLMSFEVIGTLLGRLKEETEARGIGIAQYKKILSVMIEALENIFKYNEFFEHETALFPHYYPHFKIEKKNDYFLLTTANPILNKDIEKLRNHMDKINSLDREGLRQMFRDTLTNGKFSAKGGAGLGFIEMVKISESKIDYRFDPINNNYSYYYYTILIHELN